MPQIKFQRVVSFSSEDQNQPAENLIKEGTYRKWRCKSVGEPKAWVELQLEKATPISTLDIGNHGSAFIEILVGRSGCPEEEYKALLNSASFMTPQECRNETNLSRVRIFKQQDLNRTVQTEKWDRIRVVCTQPFNKHLQYGISFITIHAPEEPPLNQSATQSALKNVDLGMFKLKEETASDNTLKQGCLFSRFKATQTAPSNSPSTQPDAIRAASQSLASIALAQSEQEAMKILKHSPRKDGRPDIKLVDKLKTTLPRSTGKTEKQSPLPSRKSVETNRLPTPQTPSIAKPENKKRDEVKLKTISSDESKRDSLVKRKASPSSSVTDKDHRMVKKPKVTKPFDRLMEDVVVTLSGFQNPLRSQLRDKLMAMGAVYKPDWNASCTHLICAFFNTPKFREVKGKGKIVTKAWVEDCFSKRKRFPWRRYCLDRNDKGEESEEEICSEENSAPLSQSPKPSTSRQTTQSKASQQEKPNANKTGGLGASSTAVVDEEDYGGSTDVDEEDTDDEIDRIKKRMLEEQSCSNTTPLAPVFKDSIFLIGEDLEEDLKNEIKCYIINFQGSIADEMNPSVSYLITNSPDDISVIKACAKNENVKLVKSEWIVECHKLNRFVSPENYVCFQTKN